MEKILLTLVLLTLPLILPPKVEAARGRSDCTPFSPSGISSINSSVEFTVGHEKVRFNRQYVTYPVYYVLEIDINKDGECKNNIVSIPLTPTTTDATLTFPFSGSTIDPCRNRVLDDADGHNDATLYQADDKGNRTGPPLCTSEYVVTNTCRAGFVMGEKEPVVTESTCESGYQPLAETQQDKVLGIIPGQTKAACVCVPESQLTTQPKYLCAQEFKPCTTDEECQQGGTGCEQHACIDINPQTIPGLPSAGEPQTKRCLAANSPYGKQYQKAIADSGKFSGASEPLKCDTATGSNTGINTALGCIPIRDTNEFIGWFLRWALGIAGGVAFVLILIAGFQITTASGNPEKVQGGKELLNAAISGLILIIFSVFLLKLIGVDILALPGFAK